MSHSTRSLAWLCLCSSAWAFSFGLEAPTASLWLRHHGYSLTTVGVNTTLYYLGIVVAGLFTPTLIRRYGRGTVVMGMLLSGVSIAAFPWAGRAEGYHLLRLVSGFGGAISVIPLESLVNHNAPPERRARDFACYAVAVAVGLAAGSVSGLHLYPHLPMLTFTLGGGITLVAVPLIAWIPKFPPVTDANSGETRALRVPDGRLCLGSAWSQGFLEAGMLALLPLCLALMGSGTEDTAWLMGAIFVGVVVLQVPIGWLADRVGRREVLVGCHLLVVSCSLLAAVTPKGPMLTALLFLAGACCGAFYPLGLSLLGEHLEEADIPRANALFLSVNCVGSCVSPLLITRSMELFGPRSMFVVGGLTAFVVLTIGIRRSRPLPCPVTPPAELRPAAAA